MTDVFADIPEGYTRNRMDPQLRTSLQKIVGGIKKLVSNNLTRLVEPSPYLEVNTMYQKSDDILLVHLVNYDVTLDGTVTPAKNIDLNILIPKGKNAKQVTYSGSLSEMAPISFVRTDQTINMKIPEVQTYGLAIVQLQE
jgi:hypothetical protein